MPERLSPALVALIEGWPLFDNAIVAHGFTPYLRDYQLEVVTLAAVPDGSRAYQEGRYRFLFTHCVLAHVETSVRDDVWPRSWDDVFTDYAAWERAGCPEGYVWGVNDARVYPGVVYLPDSPRAAEWSRRLGRPMHEVRIETNAWTLELVFHALRVHRIAHGDPAAGTLSPIEPVDLAPDAADGA
jgi:hypothetical protein